MLWTSNGPLLGHFIQNQLVVQIADLRLNPPNPYGLFIIPHNRPSLSYRLPPLKQPNFFSRVNKARKREEREWESWRDNRKPKSNGVESFNTAVPKRCENLRFSVFSSIHCFSQMWASHFQTSLSSPTLDLCVALYLCTLRSSISFWPFSRCLFVHHWKTFFCVESLWFFFF